MTINKKEALLRTVRARGDLLMEKQPGEAIARFIADIITDIEFFLSGPERMTKAEAGAIGGIAASQRPRDKNGRLLPSKPKQNTKQEIVLGQVLGDKVNPVTLWCDEYKKKYKVNYEVQKKDAGMLVNLSKGRSTERIQVLFACYLAIDDPLYKNQKHPLSLFFRDLPRVSAAAQTGINPLEEKKNESMSWMDEIIKEKKENELRALQIPDWETD